MKTTTKILYKIFKKYNNG